MPAVHVLSTFLLMQLFLGLKSGHDVLICTGNHKPISFFESIDKEATENCTDAVGVGPYPNTWAALASRCSVEKMWRVTSFQDGMKWNNRAIEGFEKKFPPRVLACHAPQTGVTRKAPYVSDLRACSGLHIGQKYLTLWLQVDGRLLDRPPK